jgi:hypothetical protein
MLAAGRIGREPDLHQFTHGTQVVDVPVRTHCNHAMVPDAGGQTSRPECASDINVEAFLHWQPAQLADVHRPGGMRGQYEGVGSGLRSHLVISYTRTYSTSK